jgi:hypothetical protein
VCDYWVDENGIVSFSVNLSENDDDSSARQAEVRVFMNCPTAAID